MKSYLILAFLAFAAFWGYAWANNPAGCKKIGKDYVVLVQSLLPGGDKIKVEPEPEEKDEPPKPPPPPVRSTTPTIVAPNYVPPPPVKGWAPPDPLPAQPHWNWTTVSGNIMTYKNVVITKVEPEFVSINHSLGAATLHISTLPADLQKQLNYTPPGPAVAQTSPIGKALAGKLFMADGKEWTSSTPIQYYAVYYSAHWCPPCRLFTPKLIEWYKGYKPSHPDFELVFASCDHSEAEMAEYMNLTGMPFPAVSYADRTDPVLRKYAGNGIPDLVLINAQGDLLLDTYQNGTYMGPGTVLSAIPSKIGGL